MKTISLTCPRCGYRLTVADFATDPLAVPTGPDTTVFVAFGKQRT